MYAGVYCPTGHSLPPCIHHLIFSHIIVSQPTAATLHGLPNTASYYQVINRSVKLSMSSRYQNHHQGLEHHHSLQHQHQYVINPSSTCADCVYVMERHLHFCMYCSCTAESTLLNTSSSLLLYVQLGHHQHIIIMHTSLFYSSLLCILYLSLYHCIFTINIIIQL